MMDDFTEEIDEEGEVVMSLDRWRSNKADDAALDAWFAGTPLVIVNAIMDAMQGIQMSPDLDRIALPYVLRLREIVL